MLGLAMLPRGPPVASTVAQEDPAYLLLIVQFEAKDDVVPRPPRLEQVPQEEAIGLAIFGASSFLLAWFRFSKPKFFFAKGLIPLFAKVVRRQQNPKHKLRA